ncbi:glycosyltransferase [Clostridium fermenticellae]|uniref:Glycosyltransferase n=1 Tax=Clostridium fermenticellae TaxID=2068654 RepID=A0A386H095_9CLOT|nr:glycosyltransferase family 2 protein [Clostridium fermenticellae]AYD39066.1 glycosyltransferase [Clostridium fermenticellae]
MEKNILISLCMIVKDEENFIDSCLKSAKDLADEIIIVDTGSTDKTRKICEKYKAKIFYLPWKDNFAEARNYGISKANGKWILWLDADEEIIIKNKNKFYQTLMDEKGYIYLVPIINYYGDFPIDINRSYLFSSYRLFRNHRDIKFTGKIHEHLTMNYSGEIYSEKALPYIEINHYGYLDSIIRKKEKITRNLKILENEKTEPNYSPWIDYHIASEYYSLKKYTKALYEINLSIIGFLKNYKLPPSLLYKLKYDILINTENYNEAKFGIEKAIKLYPDYVDLYFYKGIILFKENSFKEAILVFNQCIKLGEGNSKYLILSGAGSYLSWYFIGCCYKEINDYKKADDAFKNVLAIYPNCIKAQRELSRITKKSN